MIPLEPDDDAPEELSMGQLLRPLLKYSWLIGGGTAVVVLLTAAFAGVAYLRRPVRTVAAIGFRPVFIGADAHKYPNGLPFAASDVIDKAITDEVFASNHLRDYCDADAFRSGFFVDATSAGLVFLDADYTARLEDKNLQSFERIRLQDEYAAKRLALPTRDALTFIVPPGCAQMPMVVVSKAVEDLLVTWANDADSKRGVLKARVPVVTPAIFDAGAGGPSLLIRVDLVRQAVDHLISNIDEVQLLPGSELIRLPTPPASLREIRIKAADLIQAQLDHLLAIAGRKGRGADPEAVRWVEEAIALAAAKANTATRKVEALRETLRDYTNGFGGSPSTSQKSQSQIGNDVQTLTPQLDRTFIQSIVEMSAGNQLYRQKQSDLINQLDLEAIDLKATVDRYTKLKEQMMHVSDTDLTVEEVERQLAASIAAGKELTKRFDDLYDEFSNDSLRAGPAMYTVESPLSVSRVSSYTWADAAIRMAEALVVTPLLLGLGCFFYDRLRPWLAAARGSGPNHS